MIGRTLRRANPFGKRDNEAKNKAAPAISSQATAKGEDETVDIVPPSLDYEEDPGQFARNAQKKAAAGNAAGGDSRIDPTETGHGNADRNGGGSETPRGPDSRVHPVPVYQFATGITDLDPGRMVYANLNEIARQDPQRNLQPETTVSTLDGVPGDRWEARFDRQRPFYRQVIPAQVVGLNTKPPGHLSNLNRRQNESTAPQVPLVSKQGATAAWARMPAAPDERTQAMAARSPSQPPVSRHPLPRPAAAQPVGQVRGSPQHPSRLREMGNGASFPSQARSAPPAAAPAIQRMARPASSPGSNRVATPAVTHSNQPNPTALVAVISPQQSTITGFAAAARRDSPLPPVPLAPAAHLSNRASIIAVSAPHQPVYAADSSLALTPGPQQPVLFWQTAVAMGENASVPSFVTSNPQWSVQGTSMMETTPTSRATSPSVWNEGMQHAEAQGILNAETVNHPLAFNRPPVSDKQGPERGQDNTPDYVESLELAELGDENRWKTAQINTVESAGEDADAAADANAEVNGNPGNPAQGSEPDEEPDTQPYTEPSQEIVTEPCPEPGPEPSMEPEPGVGDAGVQATAIASKDSDLEQQFLASQDNSESSKAPAQNESRRRIGVTLTATEYDKLTALPAAAPTVAPQTQAPATPISGKDYEARAKEFLAFHNVTTMVVGFDWLSTLIHWTMMEHQKYESKIEKMEEEAQSKLELVRKEAKSSVEEAEGKFLQERDATDALKQSLATQVDKLQALATEIAKVKGDEARSRNGWMKASSQLQDAEKAAREHYGHSQELSQTIIKLTADLHTLQAGNHQLQIAASGAEQNYRTATFNLEGAQARISQLEQLNQSLFNEKNATEGQLREALGQIQELSHELGGIRVEHENALEAVKKKHISDLNSLQTGQEKKLATAKADHAKQIDGLNQQWNFHLKRLQGDIAGKEQEMKQLVETQKKDQDAKDREMAQLIDQYEKDKTAIKESVDSEIARATREARATIGRQIQQIASYNKDDYIPLDDVVFTRAFQELVQEVSQLASHVHQPLNFDFDPSFDPTNCLERNVNRSNWIWPRFVQNLCWTVLLRGFFSLPLGYGALGSQGDGHKALYPIYETLVQSTTNSETSSTLFIDNGLTLRFVTDLPGSTATILNSAETNKGRVWQFEKILAAVKPGGNSQLRYAVFFHSNVKYVAGELYRALNHVVNGQLDQSSQRLISEIARKLGMLALEMGTQRSRVVLEVCRYHEVTTPDEWRTEETDSSGGNSTVDFMIHPNLSRLGDGHQDLDTKKVMVVGQFVPLQRGY